MQEYEIALAEGSGMGAPFEHRTELVAGLEEWSVTMFQTLGHFVVVSGNHSIRDRVRVRGFVVVSGSYSLLAWFSLG